MKQFYLNCIKFVRVYRRVMSVTLFYLHCVVPVKVFDLHRLVPSSFVMFISFKSSTTLLTANFIESTFSTIQ